MGNCFTKWSNPLPLLLYHPHQPRKSPKSGISSSPRSSMSHHVAGEKRKTEQKLSCVTILVSFPQHSQPCAAHAAVCPGAVSPFVPAGISRMHLLQPLSGGRLPTAPSPQQAAFYSSPSVSPFAPHLYQRILSRVVAARLSLFPGGMEGRPTSAYMASNSVESPACLCPSAAAILYCHGEYLKGMVQQCEENEQG
jgi:hypothetical protein